MPPAHPLPFPEDFNNADEYVDSLLSFATSSFLFQTFCGGVHILDFFTQEPNIYDQVIPPDWRRFFDDSEVMELLDLFLRDDLARTAREMEEGTSSVPPSLLDFIKVVRKHSLTRTFHPRILKQPKLPRHVRVGMVEKKIHEVLNFASYVDSLAEYIATSGGGEITHFVDFGSGQNYLGRSLASPPYDKNIIAVESRKRNINGAKGMDVMAKLAEREKVTRNKKLYRQRLDSSVLSEKARRRMIRPGQEPPITHTSADFRPSTELDTVYTAGEGKGSIQYVEHIIRNGELSSVVAEIKQREVKNSVPPEAAVSSLSIAQEIASQKSSSDQDIAANKGSTDARLMAISIHSCGNLSHHGIRSLLLNPSVHAIAIVGCCYNLLTERLGPPTYKLPSMKPNMRPVNSRVHCESDLCDPHGFPMSSRFVNHASHGIRLNITARMMAVQAPQNWTQKESDAFFTRHFFRALLQRVFLDRGVVSKPNAAHFFNEKGTHKISPMGGNQEGTDPVIIGSLGKKCYASFVTYVRGAMAKLMSNPERGLPIVAKMGDITDDELCGYVERYGQRKKELSVMWSLMAFSAGVVESLIVVDRWLYLKEHGDVVKDCWVEAVFDYAQSPRNLVVVGIKR